LRTDYGQTGDALEAALQKINKKKCLPPLPESEVTAIARSVDSPADTISSAPESKGAEPLTETQVEHKDDSSSIGKRVTKHISTIKLIPDGQRNTTLYLEGLTLKKLGLTGNALKVALRKINQMKCTTPLEVSEVTRIARSVDKSGISTGESAAAKERRGKKTPKPKHRIVYAVSTSDTAVPVSDQMQKEVCVYENCRATVPRGTYTIGEVLERFKTGGNSKELIESVRNEADKEERSKLKLQLPAVIFGSEPQDERKAAACTQNCFVCLDFDSIPADKLDEAKAKIAAKPYVVAVVLSVSGTDLFALAAYEGTPNLKSLIAAMQADFPDYTLRIYFASKSILPKLYFDGYFRINERSEKI
jgi:hypothetical protein